MIVQLPHAPLPDTAAPQSLEDVRHILDLLSYTFALVASPKVSIDRARGIAKHAQKTAEAYSEVVAMMIEQGGAV